MRTNHYIAIRDKVATGRCSEHRSITKHALYNATIPRPSNCNSLVVRHPPPCGSLSTIAADCARLDLHPSTPHTYFQQATHSCKTKYAIPVHSPAILLSAMCCSSSSSGGPSSSISLRRSIRRVPLIPSGARPLLVHDRVLRPNQYQML